MCWWLYNLGGSVHQCGMFSVCDSSALSYPSSSPWRGSCTSPLLWHPHLRSFVVGCTRVEQWATGAVRWAMIIYTLWFSDQFLYNFICVFPSLSCFGTRWLIDRRVAGTKQVSTVGHLPPDPPPLSFLDSSSALSPWTSYQYRLVLENQAGNNTGTALIRDFKWS